MADAAGSTGSSTQTPGQQPNQPGQPGQQQPQGSANQQAQQISGKDTARQDARLDAQLGKDGKPTGQTPAQRAEEKRVLKLKLEGREVEIPEDRAVTELELGLVGKRRFSELQKQQAEFEARQKAAREHPELLFENDQARLEWAEQQLLEKLRLEKMTPEERRAWEAEQKLAKLEQDRKTEQQQQEEQQIQFHEEQAAAQLNAHVPAAFDEVGLSRDSPVILDIFKSYLSETVQAGRVISRETIRFAAQNTRDEIVSLSRSVVKDLSGEQIVKLLGDEIANKLRRYDLEQYDKAHGIQSSQTQQQPQQPNGQQRRPQEPQYLNERELRRRQRELGLLDE